MHCWLEFSNAGEVASHELGPGRTVLGRHRDCTVVLGSESVSRRHACIEAHGGAFVISDLGSRNGTLVNGVRIAEPTPLRPHDRISICDCELRFCSDAAGAVPDDGGERAAPHNLQVTMIDGPGAPILSTMRLAARKTASQVNPAEVLKAVLAVTRELGNNLVLEELLPRVLDSIFDIYRNADRGVILLAEEDGSLSTKARKARRGGAEELQVSRTVVDRAMKRGEAILSADAATDAQFEPSVSLMAMPIRSLMCVPLTGRDGRALGVIELHSETGAEQFTDQDLDLLVSVASAASVGVENARLHERTLRQDRLERDMSHAREVQRSFLPSGSPDLPGYAFGVHYESAQTVGGDYYGFISVPGDRVAVAVGDVSGKGMPAALMMARLSSDVRFSLLQEQDPARALALVNHSLAESGLEDRFVTFVLMVIDRQSHQVAIANAGHQSPLLRRGDGRVEEIRAERIGLPLNVSDDPSLLPRTTVVTLAVGESILVYTDGLSEADDQHGDMFGDERVAEVLAAGSGRPADVVARLVAEVRTFSAGMPQRDDTTVVCFGREA